MDPTLLKKGRERWTICILYWCNTTLGETPGLRVNTVTIQHTVLGRRCLFIHQLLCLNISFLLQAVKESAKEEKYANTVSLIMMLAQSRAVMYNSFFTLFLSSGWRPQRSHFKVGCRWQASLSGFCKVRAEPTKDKQERYETLLYMELFSFREFKCVARFWKIPL